MPTRDLGLTETRQLLEKGDFDEFIGVRENEFLEAKPGRVFDMAAGHRTNIILAKYAASFANQKGGFVICGLKISRPESTPHDVITELNLFKEADCFRPKEITGRITQSTYPSIKVDVSWYPYAKNAQVGVGVIYVPTQDEANKLFHIRVREIEGELLEKELFGVPIRADGFTDWIEVDELYRRSKAGPNSVREFYDGLSSQIQELTRAVSAPIPAVDELQKKIEQIP